MRGHIQKYEKAVSSPQHRKRSRTSKLRPVNNIRWQRWSLCILLFLFAVATASGFWFRLQNQTISAAFQTVVHRLERTDRVPTPFFTVKNSKTLINNPLPLGIVLINTASDETVVLSGLPEGTSLSVGTPLTATRWSVPGRDLDKAYISAPENFDGVMEVGITLYSSKQDILETEHARFEWKGSGKADKLPITIAPDRHISR